MRRKITLIVLSVVLTAAALEIGWRVYVSNFGTERQRVLYLFSRAEIEATESLYRGLPFVNFGLSPAGDDVNSLGYRGPEVAIPKAPGGFRIVALGGSTTYGGYLDSYELAYPHQLQLELATVYGLDQVEVVNAGVPAYSTWETSVNFMLRVPDLNPDMIIIYHALNDLAPRMVNPASYHGGYEARGLWKLPDEQLPWSALQRLVMHKLGRSVRLEFSLDAYLNAPDHIGRCDLDTSGAEPICRGLDTPPGDLLKANPPIYFRRNLSNIISVAQHQDIKALLVTWAYSPHEYDGYFGDVMIHKVLQLEVARHNDISRDLAEARGALLYDLANEMPAEKKFWHNGIHMSAAGTREMARQLADFLVSNGHLD